MKPNDFRKLAAAGLTTEQIAIVMEIMDDDRAQLVEAEDARKAKARERIARWRRNRNATETQQNATSALTDGGARVEDKTSNSEIEPQKKTNTHSADLAAFKSALSGVCDSERIDAFVKHRRMKRGANTGHAAKLFLADAEACGLSVPAAIDMAISRNWITVKPEFLAGRQQRAGPVVVPIKDTPANAARRRLDEAIDHERRNQPTDHPEPAPSLVPLLGGRAGG
jgi:hypothetical protein